MSGIKCYRYEGFPMSEKFAWINGSPGLEAVSTTADNVRGMGRRLGEISHDADRSMKGLQISWTGPAAESAQKSLEQTVKNASLTRSLSDNGAERILDYGRSYEWMRPQIAYDDPSKYSKLQKIGDATSEIWSSVLGDGEDHITVGERNQANAAIADRVLSQHETNARQADDAFVTSGVAPAAVSNEGRHAGSPGADGGPTRMAPTSPQSVAPADATPSLGSTPGPSPAASSSPASPTSTLPPGSGPTSASIPPGGGKAGSGRPEAGSKAHGPEAERKGGQAGPTRAISDAPTATAQAPSTGSQGGLNRGQHVPGAPSAGAGSGNGLTTGGLGSGAFGTGIPTATDPSTRRAELGRSFGRDLAASRLAAPGGSGYGGGTSRPSTGWGGTPTSGGAGSSRLGWGAEGGGRSATGGGGGESGGRAAAGEQRGWARSGAEGLGGRAPVGEPTASGRSGTGSGYGPMMGGAGAGAGQNGQDHRNRYLIPTDEAFDVDLTCTPPVLGPLADDERD